ncbi:hypothetical protein AVEN_1988-1 [Araneus ventricosus]|uniref:Uncharacterized protein n=1 Tax=Araneus ventricosus TaxID=182803 RepID=A0A4Y2PY60_ARAVE|nr:hypothetical protein AVEN_1988-1 [Araneus ventricosus]
MKNEVQRSMQHLTSLPLTKKYIQSLGKPLNQVSLTLSNVSDKPVTESSPTIQCSQFLVGPLQRKMKEINVHEIHLKKLPRELVIARDHRKPVKDKKEVHASNLIKKIYFLKIDCNLKPVYLNISSAYSANKKLCKGSESIS